MELMPGELSFECSESLSGVPPPSARLFEPQQCERIQGIHFDYNHSFQLLYIW